MALQNEQTVKETIYFLSSLLILFEKIDQFMIFRSNSIQTSICKKQDT